METIQPKNLTYNDTPEVRLFSSEKFNWCLDKSTGISCCWGADVKETPQYDPCGVQEFVWNITDFDLNRYIKYFNFLANIKYKKDDKISDIPKNCNVLKNTENLICLSTFGSFILCLDNFTVTEDIKTFLNYIRNFNIEPKIQLDYKNFSEDITNYKDYSENFILTAKYGFDCDKLVNAVKVLQEQKINVCVKVFLNKDNLSIVNRYLTKINDSISTTIYCTFPYLSTRKFLEFQSKCLSKKYTNVCLTQCAKEYYSKDIIGSLLLELPCSFCRYSLYLKNNIIYTCENRDNPVGKIEDYKTILDFWNSEKIVNIRKNLIDTNRC